MKAEKSRLVESGRGAAPSGSPLPAPDLSDIDRIHRMIATNRLADIFTRLAGGQKS